MSVSSAVPDGTAIVTCQSQDIKMPTHVSKGFKIHQQIDHEIHSSNTLQKFLEKEIICTPKITESDLLEKAADDRECHACSQ
jgi:hypothetical protein